LQANKAALKAMYLNRIGDFGLALAIFTIFFYFKSLDYSVVFALSPSFLHTKIFFLSNPIFLLDFIGFFLFVGAVGKSAQIGLHT
jgi:NADH:ubiquinone oxidoreductase subunit 5 (subunit L)/multisubunit Na+/H+ antiporter MnhA subunit